MKTLCLVRHAKAGWKDDPTITDFERPLNDVGREEAQAAGKKLKRAKIDLELLISSPAKRAFATAEIMAEEIGYPPGKIKKDPLIYDGGLRELLRVLKGIDDAFDRVAIFGHNPSMSDLLNYLTGEGESMVTAGMSLICFDEDSWGKVGKKGRIINAFKK